MAIKGLVRIRGIRSPMAKGTIIARSAGKKGPPSPHHVGSGLSLSVGSGGGTITFQIGGIQNTPFGAVIGGSPSSAAVIGNNAQITLPTAPGPTGTLWNNAGVVAIA
jgi:hypothetical protein